MLNTSIERCDRVYNSNSQCSYLKFHVSTHQATKMKFIRKHKTLSSYTVDLNCIPYINIYMSTDEDFN